MKKYMLASCLAACIFIFTSCATIIFGTNYDLDERMKSLRIGMSKTEVVQILGDDYKVMSLMQTHEGDQLETLRYSGAYDTYYIHFENGWLVEFNRELPPPVIINPEPTKVPYPNQPQPSPRRTPHGADN